MNDRAQFEAYANGQWWMEGINLARDGDGYSDTDAQAAWEIWQAARAKPVVPEWVSVSDRLPDNGKPVLASYTNRYSKGRTIRAHYIKAFTVEADADTEISDCDYSEKDDCYFYPEGWYELIDNWGDYSSVAVVEGEVTNWMPLPEPPKEMTK